MSSYVIVDNTVHNEGPYRDYLTLITPTVEKYGGRYLVRAGEIHYRDSDWNPDRLVIMEFNSPAEAKAWVTSSELAYIHAMRREYATSKLIIIEGVSDPASGAN